MCELTSGKGGSYLSQVYVLRGGGRVCGKVGERDGWERVNVYMGEKVSTDEL